LGSYVTAPIFKIKAAPLNPGPAQRTGFPRFPMNKGRKSIYLKHVYWLTADEEDRLRGELASKDITLKRAKGVVCTPLDPINKISSVPPEVWNETCARQGSWYRTSEKMGLYLVISSFELAGYEGNRAATIMESDFEPPRLASREEKESLVSESAFVERVPPEWHRIGDLEKRIYLRWAKRLGSETEDYDFLFLSQTANHANFVRPRFFTREGGLLVPYSIDRSAHLCSSCLELFQILGEGYQKKLVAPCPGATIFARLKRDRYLLVESSGRQVTGREGRAHAA
jgi:hypothetical protein